jgi:hypothetical protein
MGNLRLRQIGHIHASDLTRQERQKQQQNTGWKTWKKTIKNTATWHLHHASRSQHLLDEQCRQSTNTVPSDNKTCASCNNTNKDKKYHLHFDKKLKAGCVVVVSLASLTIDGQVKSKEQKEQDFSFILGQQSLILQTLS